MKGPRRHMTICIQPPQHGMCCIYMRVPNEKKTEKNRGKRREKAWSVLVALHPQSRTLKLSVAPPVPCYMAAVAQQLGAPMVAQRGRKREEVRLFYSLL